MNFLCRVHGPNGAATAALATAGGTIDSKRRPERPADRSSRSTRFPFPRGGYIAPLLLFTPLPRAPPSPPTTRREFTARPRSPPSSLPPLYFANGFSKRRTGTPTRLSSADKYYSPRIFDSMNVAEGRGWSSSSLFLSRNASYGESFFRIDSYLTCKETRDKIERERRRIRIPIAKRKKKRNSLSFFLLRVNSIDLELTLLIRSNCLPRFTFTAVVGG